MAKGNETIKGIDRTQTSAVKGQGQSKEKPNVAQQAPVTKPTEAPPSPKKEK